MEMKSWVDCWVDTELSRSKIDPNRICTFGVKPLDDALGGMLPNDLAIIGADSGSGKSEMGLDIAVHNASNGKKVGLYFIEGGDEEAMFRIKWKMIQNRYYKNGHKGLDMEYRNWRMNKLNDPLLDRIVNECLQEAKDKIKDNLYIYNFEEGFRIENLINSLGYFAKQINKPGAFLLEHKIDLDLIIIDHLQYFSMNEYSNEFAEQTQILMKVKDIANHHNIPVVLISHLRKKERDRGLPNQEDFHGSSNICKVASIAITMAPSYNKEDYANQMYPTFFRIVKSRTGIRPSYAMLCDFDLKNGRYVDTYQMYKVIHNKVAEAPIDRFKLPLWAYKSVLEKEKENVSYTN